MAQHRPPKDKARRLETDEERRRRLELEEERPPAEERRRYVRSKTPGFVDTERT
jgi:hypothetical protein